MSDDRSKEMFLLRKQDVEKSIKSMEENPDSDLEYNVLSSVNPHHPKTPFLISYKIAPSNDILYDVLYADVPVESHTALLGKKRLEGKNVKITNTLDLTKLIEQYYE